MKITLKKAELSSRQISPRESYTKGDCDENAIAVTYIMFITPTKGEDEKSNNLEKSGLAPWKSRFSLTLCWSPFASCVMQSFFLQREIW